MLNAASGWTLTAYSAEVKMDGNKHPFPRIPSWLAQGETFLRVGLFKNNLI
jgi:hypothetical protein